MSNSIKSSALFSFSTYLWFNKSPLAVSKKDGYVSLYLQIYIGVPGASETEEFRLNLRWPPDKIDRKASILKPRYRGDKDVNDYNIIIMAERGIQNEIAKLYRLSNKRLTIKDLKRDMKIYNYRESVVAYMDKRRRELYLKSEIVEQTYKNVGSTIYSLLQYQPAVRFDEINVKWMMAFKIWLVRQKLKPSTVWTTMKDLKRYLGLANEEKFLFVDEDAVRFPNPEPAPITIFLNREELKRLIMLMDESYLTKNELNVLKAFIFTCFTSLRISDV